MSSPRMSGKEGREGGLGTALGLSPVCSTPATPIQGRGTAKCPRQPRAGGRPGHGSSCIPEHLQGNQPLPTAAASPSHSTGGSGPRKAAPKPRCVPKHQSQVRLGAGGAPHRGLGQPRSSSHRGLLGSHHAGSVTSTRGLGLERGPGLSWRVGTSNLGRGWQRSCPVPPVPSHLCHLPVPPVPLHLFHLPVPPVPGTAESAPGLTAPPWGTGVRGWAGQTLTEPGGALWGDPTVCAQQCPDPNSPRCLRVRSTAPPQLVGSDHRPARA